MFVYHWRPSLSDTLRIYSACSAQATGRGARVRTFHILHDCLVQLHVGFPAQSPICHSHCSPSTSATPSTAAAVCTVCACIYMLTFSSLSGPGRTTCITVFYSLSLGYFCLLSACVVCDVLSHSGRYTHKNARSLARSPHLCHRVHVVVLLRLLRPPGRNLSTAPP